MQSNESTKVMKSWNRMFLEPEQFVSKDRRQNASYVRKKFLVEKDVKSATLNFTACGIYKAFFNGAEIDNQVLLPSLTDYNKRLQYHTYDMTEHIVVGENVICAELGDCWYRGRVGLVEKTYYYGEKIKLLCVLQIVYEDGSKEDISGLSVSYLHGLRLQQTKKKQTSPKKKHPLNPCSEC